MNRLCIACGKRIPVRTNLFKDIHIDIECPHCHKQQTIHIAEANFDEEQVQDNTQNMRDDSVTHASLMHFSNRTLISMILVFLIILGVFWLWSWYQTSYVKNTLQSQPQKRLEQKLDSSQVKQIQKDTQPDIQNNPEEAVELEEDLPISNFKKTNVRKIRNLKNKNILPNTLIKVYKNFDPFELQNRKEQFLAHRKKSSDDQVFSRALVAQIYIYLGNWFKEFGWIKYAEKEIDLLSETSPKNAEVLKALALKNYFSGSLKNASIALKKSNRADDLSEVLMSRLNFMKLRNEKNLNRLERTSQKYPQMFFAKYLLAVSFQEAREWKKSELLFKQLLKQYPKSSKLLFELAQTQKSLGKLEETQIQLQQALTFAPKNNLIKLELGSVENSLRKYQAAKLTFLSLEKEKRIRFKNEQNFELFYGLGYAYFFLKQHVEAQKWFSKAQYINGQRLDLSELMIKNFVALNQYKSARILTEEALKLHPNRKSLIQYQVAILSYEKKHTQVIENLAPFVAKGDESHFVSYYRALAYWNLGNIKQSSELAEDSLKQAKTSDEKNKSLGLLDIIQNTQKNL